MSSNLLGRGRYQGVRIGRSVSRSTNFFGIFITPDWAFTSLIHLIPRGGVMVVKTRNNGREITGLYIGAENARRFFPRSLSTVDLKLGELQIQCSLPPHFWQEDPEIRDARLCGWLACKVAHARTSRTPVFLTMVPCGTNSFMVQSTMAGELVEEAAMSDPAGKFGPVRVASSQHAAASPRAQQPYRRGLKGELRIAVGQS